MKNIPDIKYTLIDIRFFSAPLFTRALILQHM